MKVSKLTKHTGGDEALTTNYPTSPRPYDIKNMLSSQLMKLFKDQLKDIYWTQKALINALPMLIEKSTSQELIDVLNNQLVYTVDQIQRLYQVFESIGKRPSAKKCQAIESLVNEGEEIMDNCEDGAMCDAGIILAVQKIVHYEIALYGTLGQFAETLGLHTSSKLLMESLNEEKTTDLRLTQIAVNTVNIEAAETEA